MCKPFKEVIVPKLTLKLEHLCVETFATETHQTKKGTVIGAQGTAYTVCTCPGDDTCAQGCSDLCSNGCVTPTQTLRTCYQCPDEY